MTDLQVTSPLEPLLEHAGWLRRLAARLVAGPHDAEDVVQEVWRATLAAERTDVRAPRAWLAGALRNVLKMRARGDARRREREQAAAGAVEVPSAAELAGEQDVRRLLLEHVEALTEDERDVVLLRFYRDLPPRDVATELGIPVNTVRSRTARALQRLRERLDAQHGDRRAWCLALVPLLDPRGLQAVGVGEGVRRSSTLLLGAAAAVVVLGGVVAYQQWSARRVLDLAQATPADQALLRFAVAGDEGAAVERVAAPASNRAFAGRVVDLEGAPIEGATLFLRDRMVGNTIVDIGDREQWTRRTGADGSFSYELASLPLVGGSIKIGEVVHPDYEAELGYSVWKGEQVPVLAMRRAYDTFVDVEIVDADSGEPIWFSASGHASWGDYPDPMHITAGDPNKRDVASRPDRGGVGALRFPMRVVAGARNTVELTIPGGETIRHELEAPASHGHVYTLREQVRLVGGEGANRLTGVVTDAETGGPVAMARVSLTRTWTEGRWTHTDLRRTQSRSGGRYELAYPEAFADAELVVEHDDYLDLRVGFGGEPRRACALRRRPSLEVVVQHAGRPLADVPLMAIYGRSDERVRVVTNAEGRVAFGRVNAERVALYVLPRPGAADEHAILNRAVRLQAGVDEEVVLDLHRPDRVAVFGNVPAAPGGVAMLPTFVPLADGRGWIAARRLGVAGYEAGDVQRGRYLVLLTPAEDHHREGPFALCSVVSVDGVLRQALDFALPTGRVHGRIVGRAGDGLRVVALPVLDVRSAAVEQLFASPKLGKYLGASPASDGFFSLDHVPDGPCRLELRRGAEVVATKRVEVVAGEAVVGDWQIRK